MELREFLTPFIKNWKILLSTAILLGLAAGVISYRLPIKHCAAMTLFVRKEPEASQEYYTYDGFYAQKASEEYTDTVVGLLQSDGIRRQAGIKKWGELTRDLRRRLQKSIRVEKTAPQLVKLDITWDDGEEASELVIILSDLVKEKAEFSKSEAGKKVEVVTLDSEPVVKKLEPNLPLNSMVGAGGGLLLAVAVIWIKEYLQED